MTDYLEGLPLAAIISELESHRVIYLNSSAKAYFGISETREGLTSLELLRLSEEDLIWYQEMKTSSHTEYFQPVFFEREENFLTVLDSGKVEYEGRSFRLDLINTQDYDSIRDYRLYSYVFERMMKRLERHYDENPELDADISQLLDIILYVYAGDRAFIYELDRDLNCTVDIYERCRTGFKAHNDKYKTQYASSMQFLEAVGQQGIPYFSITEEVTDNILRERMELGLVIRTMGVHFPARSGMDCFLCIDNPRRFWKEDTYLKYVSYLIANDFHIAKIQGHLEASYLLNKTLSGKNGKANTYSVYMFGGFEIQTPNGILRDGSFRSPQVCVLISFLLLNRRRVLSIYEISEALWPGQVLDNPYNQIKNVVFRARKAMDGICERPLIEASSGTYMINNKLNIWTDIEEFERLCRKASQENLPAEQRLELYESAFRIYRGGMLPFIEPELWLLTTVSYYQLLYNSMVTQYIQLLCKSRQFIKAFSVAATATNVEPSNFEIHEVLLEALLLNHNDELARKYYQQISLRLSKKQKEHFRQLWKSLTDRA